MPPPTLPAPACLRCLPFHQRRPLRTEAIITDGIIITDGGAVPASVSKLAPAIGTDTTIDIPMAMIPIGVTAIGTGTSRRENGPEEGSCFLLNVCTLHGIEPACLDLRT